MSQKKGRKKKRPNAEKEIMEGLGNLKTKTLEFLKLLGDLNEYSTVVEAVIGRQLTEEEKKSIKELKDSE